MQNNNNEQPTTPPAMPQKRIRAMSVVGDNVWKISIPVLRWMVENGDEALQKRASATIAFWEREQAWFIEWGNNTGYFQMAERACHDLKQYKQAMQAIPMENEAMQRIRELALMTGELFNKPAGIGRKNVLKQRKQSRGKRK